MLIDFIFLLVLFVLLYSYTNSQNQFAATASAIRQIWSGSCRLSCQHSEHSALSGLSGLPPRAVRHLGQESMTARSSFAGPSRDCNCESCPCAHIENFLRSCRPATTLYSQLIESTSNFITYVLQMLVDGHGYILRVLDCNTACQRHAQVVSVKDSRVNFKFAKDDKEINEEVKGTLEGTSNSNEREDYDRNFDYKLVSKESKKETFRLKHVETDLDAGVGTSKEVKAENDEVLLPKTIEAKKSIGPTKSSSNIQNSSEDSIAEKGLCLKCTEKGHTCIKDCPRANNTYTGK